MVSRATMILSREGVSMEVESISGDLKIPLPVLDGIKNFHRWSVMMGLLFNFHEVMEIVQDGISEVEESASKEKDWLALTLIHQCVNSEILERIGAAKNAKQAWEILQHAYHGSGKESKEGSSNKKSKKNNVKAESKISEKSKQENMVQAEPKISVSENKSPYVQEDAESIHPENSDAAEQTKCVRSCSQFQQDNIRDNAEKDEGRTPGNQLEDSGVVVGILGESCEIRVLEIGVDKMKTTVGLDAMNRKKKTLQEIKNVLSKKLSEGSLQVKEKPKVKAREHEHDGDDEDVRDGDCGESEGSHERTLFPGTGQTTSFRYSGASEKLKGASPVVEKSVSFTGPRSWRRGLKESVVCPIVVEGSKEGMVSWESASREKEEFSEIRVSGKKLRRRSAKQRVMKKQCRGGRTRSSVYLTRGERSHTKQRRKGNFATERKKKKRLCEWVKLMSKKKTAHGVAVSKLVDSILGFCVAREKKRSAVSARKTKKRSARGIRKLGHYPVLDIGPSGSKHIGNLMGLSPFQVQFVKHSNSKCDGAVKLMVQSEKQSTLGQSGVAMGQAQCMQRSEWVNVGLIFKPWDPGTIFVVPN